jgi:hypothetical protein
MSNALKLIVERPANNDDFEYVLEEKNPNQPATLFIKGPYMMAEYTNRNRRIYNLEEMAKEVGRYTNEMIRNNRSMGELNHPQTPEVNLERVCHMVTELRQEGNVFYGKSKVLSTPMGMIVKSLIQDGVKVGMSSRALGKLTESANNINKVSDFRLVAIDCVADPSFPKAFVDGILESKQFVLKESGQYEEIYDSFSDALRHLPRNDVESFLKEQVVLFFRKLSSKS